MADKADGAQAVRWRVPNMAGEGTHSDTLIPGQPIAPPTADDVAAWEQAGREDGFKHGFAEGKAAAAAETAQLQQRLRSLCQDLSQVLASFGEQAEEELVQLALAIAQQLVRRELRTDPGELVPVVRDAISLLPVSAQHLRVHLHPEDAAVVRDALGSGDFDGAIQIVEDPLITRGGCKVEADNSHLDATLETRLAALSASVLAAGRDGD